MTTWKRENAFCALLAAAKKRLTKGTMQELTQIAMRDHRQCYKHVIAYIQRQARDASPEQRMNLLYVLSDILLAAQKRLGESNRYRRRLEEASSTPFRRFVNCPRDKVTRVVSWLTKARVFSEPRLRRIEESLGIASTPPTEPEPLLQWPFGVGRDGYAIKCRIFPEAPTAVVWDRICEDIAHKHRSQQPFSRAPFKDSNEMQHHCGRFGINGYHV